jgi:hypothetical protein
MPHFSVPRYFLRLAVILVFGMIGVVLAEASDSAQGNPIQAPEGCATCHLDVVNAWQAGLHAQAYSDPVFQQAWEAQNKNVTCLACHTTGFVPRTGEYVHEGVTCEACHGPTPADHPPAPMKIDPGVETCADCHATTYAEWQQSAHGQQQLACTTCHNPHPQTLRFDSPNTLCLNCHKDAPTDYAHLVHTQQQCTDCHWFHASKTDLIAHGVSGALFPTGHSASVGTAACIDCHEQNTTTTIVQQEQQAQQELGLSSAHPILDAQVKIEELQAQVKTVDAQGANTSVLRLAQGFIVGVVLGAVVVFGALRFRRHHSTIERPEEK